VEVTLTGEEINELDGCIDEFQAANYRGRERIVKRFLLSFMGDLTEEEYDDVTMRTVCAQFSTLGCA